MSNQLEAAKRPNKKKLTPLGEIYFKKAAPWQRTKIVTEMMQELNVGRSSVRAYMVSTPGYRMRADMKAIILRTLPEAADCFNDPRVLNPNQQPA